MHREWSGVTVPDDSMDVTIAVNRWTEVDLDELADGWCRLAERASTPNPFFEEWFLRPAFELADPRGVVSLARLEHGTELLGLMPIYRPSAYGGRRIPHLATWLHLNAFLGGPLVAAGYELAFWRQLIEWADANAAGAMFLHCAQVPAETELRVALECTCRLSQRQCRTVRSTKRALLVRGVDRETHLRSAMGSKHRKELRRKRRRFEELGDFAFSRSRDEVDLERWTNEFLALERSGWKGRGGSALASDSRTESFFRRVIASAAARGRLERLAFHLDGDPIAMLCNFRTVPGSFAFKTTYDETYAKLSPGMLLQVENLSLLSDTHIEWSDSCAVEHHPMIDRIWTDRRTIESVSIPIGGRLRRLAGTGLTFIETQRAERRK